MVSGHASLTKHCCFSPYLQLGGVNSGILVASLPANSVLGVVVRFYHGHSRSEWRGPGDYISAEVSDMLAFTKAAASLHTCS